MCPTAAEKPKGASKGVTLAIKLDGIERFNHGERYKDLCALNLPPCIPFTHRKRILKADEVTIGSASSKGVLVRTPVTDKMDNLLLEWTDWWGCIYHIPPALTT